MGLSATIKKAIKTAFTALGDAVGPATYQSVGATSVYDEDSGTMVYPITSYRLPMVAFVKFSVRETDKDPTLSTSEKMLFPLSDLPVAPKVQDKVIDGAGVIWQIIRVMGDPINAVGILQVRA